MEQIIEKITKNRNLAVVAAASLVSLLIFSVVWVGVDISNKVKERT